MDEAAVATELLEAKVEAAERKDCSASLDAGGDLTLVAAELSPQQVHVPDRSTVSAWLFHGNRTASRMIIPFTMAERITMLKPAPPRSLL